MLNIDRNKPLLSHAQPQSFEARIEAVRSQNLPLSYTPRLHTASLNTPYNPQPLPASSQYVPATSIDSLPEPTTTTYGNTTHPVNHNNRSFRYLVHSFRIQDMNTLPSQIGPLSPGLTFPQAKTMQTEYTANRLQSYREPTALSERPSISASLIDENNRNTYGQVGYIIETTNANILAARPNDLWVNNWDPHSVLNQTALQGRLTGDELLKQTTPDTYNEVVIGGKAMNRGPITITGVFYKVDGNNIPSNQEAATHIQRVAADNNLVAIPIIKGTGPLPKDN